MSHFVDVRLVPLVCLALVHPHNPSVQISLSLRYLDTWSDDPSVDLEPKECLVGS